ncbi:PREDICTED: myocyte-specific enhancer factor 2-like [Populus euphratica]|uniref:Myocyte-specific enhancer factor 2-like n=1 Tax=Populus euphratica TaxID=75702 RepID=A0AAJ6U735_POPEU|nr:PREDICTED: myocyte-specific enhancer factor 2-like [Populus euphratica]
MGQKRIKMELIRKEKSRMLTFRKRKAGLLKKASEFSILCGVDACVIIFGPKEKDDHQPVAPETWPPSSEEVRCIISRYKGSDQPRRCYQVSDYFADKKKQIDSELARLHKQIIKTKYPAWDDRLNSLYADQLRVLVGHLDAKIDLTEKKLGSFNSNQYSMGAPGVQAASLSPSVSHDNMESYMKSRDDNLLQLIHNSNPFDAQPAMVFYPEQSSHVTNLLERKYSNGCPTDLQVYYEPRPLDDQLLVGFQSKQTSYRTTRNASFWESNNGNCYSTDLQLYLEPNPLNIVQPPMHFQPKQNVRRTSSYLHAMEDAIMKMACDQNTSDQFGCKLSSSSNLPCANRTPWMWDNVWFNNADSSVSYIAPTTQPIMSSIQFPMSSFPHQMQSSEASDFTGNLEFEGKGQGYN